MSDQLLDQVRALLATVGVLHRRLPAAPEHLQAPAPAPTAGGADRHLPRRSV